METQDWSRAWSHLSGLFTVYLPIDKWMGNEVECQCPLKILSPVCGQKNLGNHFLNFLQGMRNSPTMSWEVGITIYSWNNTSSFCSPKFFSPSLQVVLLAVWPPFCISPILQNLSIVTEHWGGDGAHHKKWIEPRTFCMKSMCLNIKL